MPSSLFNKAEPAVALAAPALAPAMDAPAWAVPATIDAAIDRNTTKPTIELSAQTKKPCAVSLKYTSSRCTSVHFVRKRPVTYPEIPYAIICVTNSQTIVPIARLVPEIPSFCQGDTERNP